MIKTYESIYRSWQNQKNKITLASAEKFYAVEAELFQRALDEAKLRELENRIMFENSPKQKLIRARSRVFETLSEDKKINLVSVVERLCNLNKKIYE